MTKYLYKNVKTMPIMPATSGSMEINQTGDVSNTIPVINDNLCTKCMICWKFCPDVAIDIKNKKPIVNLKYCKGCGICATECPKNAIEMVIK